MVDNILFLSNLSFVDKNTISLFNLHLKWDHQFLNKYFVHKTSRSITQSQEHAAFLKPSQILFNYLFSLYEPNPRLVQNNFVKNSGINKFMSLILRFPTIDPLLIFYMIRRNKLFSLYWCYLAIENKNKLSVNIIVEAQEIVFVKWIHEQPIPIMRLFENGDLAIDFENEEEGMRVWLSLLMFHSETPFASRYYSNVVRNLIFTDLTNVLGLECLMMQKKIPNFNTFFDQYFRNAKESIENFVRTHFNFEHNTRLFRIKTNLLIPMLNYTNHLIPDVNISFNSKEFKITTNKQSDPVENVDRNDLIVDIWGHEYIHLKMVREIQLSLVNPITPKWHDTYVLKCTPSKESICSLFYVVNISDERRMTDVACQVTVDHKHRMFIARSIINNQSTGINRFPFLYQLDKPFELMVVLDQRCFFFFINNILFGRLYHSFPITAIKFVRTSNHNTDSKITTHEYELVKKIRKKYKQEKFINVNPFYLTKNDKKKQVTFNLDEHIALLEDTLKFTNCTRISRKTLQIDDLSQPFKLLTNKYGIFKFTYEQIGGYNLPLDFFNFVPIVKSNENYTQSDGDRNIFMIDPQTKQVNILTSQVTSFVLHQLASFNTSITFDVLAHRNLLQSLATINPKDILVGDDLKVTKTVFTNFLGTLMDFDEYIKIENVIINEIEILKRTRTTGQIYFFSGNQIVMTFDENVNEKYEFLNFNKPTNIVRFPQAMFNKLTETHPIAYFTFFNISILTIDPKIKELSIYNLSLIGLHIRTLTLSENNRVITFEFDLLQTPKLKLIENNNDKIEIIIRNDLMGNFFILLAEKSITNNTSTKKLHSHFAPFAVIIGKY